MINMTVRKSVRATLIGLTFLWSADRACAEDNGKTVTGAMLYHAHCASCHGEQGRGDGMVGKMLRTPPCRGAWELRPTQLTCGKIPLEVQK